MDSAVFYWRKDVKDMQSSTSALTFGYCGKYMIIPLTPATSVESTPSTVFMFPPPCLVSYLSVEPPIHRAKVLPQLLAPAAIMVVRHHLCLFLLYVPFLLHLGLMSSCMERNVGQIFSVDIHS